jgi:hypothetical protein
MFHLSICNFEVICTEQFFVAPDFLASRPSIDDLSAKLKTLEVVHESLQATLKESQSNEIKQKGSGGQACISHGGAGEETPS